MEVVKKYIESQISPNNQILPFFNQLGESIRKKWSTYDYTEDALPDVAMDELAKFKLHTQIKPQDILELALSADPTISAFQTDSNFGDLQLIVYRHARFFIEILYWVEGTTAIHDHGFSGAFTVIHGSTINVEYSFSEIKKINHHFYLGDLSVPLVKKLESGSIETIYSGKRFIHAAFHLEKPTVSIVVRTHQDDDAMPQFEYRGKHLRIVRDFAPEFAKKIQSLRFIEENDSNRFRDSFIKLFIHSPMDERYWLARAFYMIVQQDHDLWAFLNNLRHQGMMEYLLNSIEEERLLIQGIKLRAKIQDSDFKYFIALLLNIPTWKGILDFVKSQEGNLHSIQRWIETAIQLGLDVSDFDGYRASNVCDTNNGLIKLEKRWKTVFNDLLKNRLGRTCRNDS